jgi:D-threo-aldose 1-dehydrogenase
MILKRLGQTELEIPPIIFGTSCLGNLYQALTDDTKREIMRQWFEQDSRPIVLDSAGKYGAGLALETIGWGLKEMNIASKDVQISNKLGWVRTPLRTREPLFEPGVWKGISHDAVQRINYKGIMECWEQGCELLGPDYQPQILSVHDPDEYLTQAKNKEERKKLLTDIIDAYRALIELKNKGLVQAIGIGAKDWKVIREIISLIELDWVMLAISFTIFAHTPALLAFINELFKKEIPVINSAVFHAGFLTGGEYFDYRKLNSDRHEDKPYFQWREKFFAVCKKFQVTPAEACVQFGMSHPVVISIALNTSKPKRIHENLTLLNTPIPDEFWHTLKTENLISPDYPYLG